MKQEIVHLFCDKCNKPLSNEFTKCPYCHGELRPVYRHEAESRMLGKGPVGEK